MWKVETEGRGRRAVVLSISNDVVSYSVGDLVHCGDSVGGIVAFKQGETNKTHEVQMLEFVLRDDEILATSLLRWHGIETLGDKLDKSSIQVRRAIDHHRHHHDKIEEIPGPVHFETGADLLNLSKQVLQLFLKPVTPRKRRSPRKKEPTPLAKLEISSESSPAKGINLKAMAMDDDSFSSDESGTDEEQDLVPARKRKSRAKKVVAQMAATSLDTPKKPGFKNDDDDIYDVDEGISDDEKADVQPIGGSRTGKPRSNAAPGTSVKFIPKSLSRASQLSLVDLATAELHPASDPTAHMCRDGQFDQLFVALESAIAAQTGTCIYVSGTPGTGKTSIIREVVGQLDLRVREEELSPFTFLEINGMKLVHPNAAYEHLWEALGRGQMAASNAMSALESVFTANEPLDKRGVIVLLLDELDQLVTKGQQLMYNFFNWPSLPHSRMIVIAVANTMDLPERMLSNKISSRIGLTRIQFPGYTHTELKEIVAQRLGEKYSSLIEDEAIEYATRKVAGVGGDARRVLDFVRQAIFLAANQSDTDEGSGGLPVKTSHVRDVIIGSQMLPLAVFIKTLGISTKVLLCALLARARRTSNIEAPMHDVLKQASQFVRSAADSENLVLHLYPGRSARLAFFQSAIMELVESGIIVQQAIKGEASPRVRLMVPAESIKEQLEHDAEVKGMI